MPEDHLSGGKVDGSQGPRQIEQLQATMHSQRVANDCVSYDLEQSEPLAKVPPLMMMQHICRPVRYNLLRNLPHVTACHAIVLDAAAGEPSKTVISMCT